MTQPSFSCPRCGYETFLPSDIAAGYCRTGDSLLGSEDVMAQNAIDGPLSIAPVSDSLRSEIELEWFVDDLTRLAAEYGMTADEYVGATQRIIEHVQDPTHSMSTLVVSYPPSRPTYRVARFVRALRRFRR